MVPTETPGQDTGSKIIDTIANAGIPVRFPDFSNSGTPLSISRDLYKHTQLPSHHVTDELHAKYTHVQMVVGVALLAVGADIYEKVTGKSMSSVRALFFDDPSQLNQEEDTVCQRVIDRLGDPSTSTHPVADKGTSLCIVLTDGTHLSATRLLLFPMPPPLPLTHRHGSDLVQAPCLYHDV